MIIIDESSMMMHHHFSIIIICVISTLTVHPTCVGRFANKFSQPLLMLKPFPMLKPLLMFETSPNVSTSPNVVSHGDAVILHHHGFYFLVSQPLHQKKLLQMFFLIQQSCWKNMLWIYRFSQIGGICANCLFLYLCIIDQPFIYDCRLLSVELDQMLANLANYSTFEKWWHTATQIVNCAVQLWEKSQYQEVTEGQYSQWPFCRNVTKISFWNGNPCPW